VKKRGHSGNNRMPNSTELHMLALVKKKGNSANNRMPNSIGLHMLA
jgi:hypothetical protein